MKIAIRAAALLSLAWPAAGWAQVNDCMPPTAPVPVHPELPTAEQPARQEPIGGYTLALIWTPHFCRQAGNKPGADFECGNHAGGRFGFVLHGLWPDGMGATWPQYCTTTPLLPAHVIRGAMCTTPSAQLLQHEWAKHGTCMAGYDPARYFRLSTGLYAKLRFPDMDALAAAPLSAGDLALAMAKANPGLRADGMRITTDRQGWLDEIWLCLDKTFAFVRCPAGHGGVSPGTSLRIAGRTP
ncbi:ribonuclease T [Sphingomonas bacterium]|uniref:ribonuclease T2 family protein n=1 Tax=Sphingomonas bacterium TaxID=1895847 RepID=UPI0015769737|nr:ribonuclease T [Sphingomonas bacterium]